MPFSSPPGVSLRPDSSTRNIIQPTGDFVPLIIKQISGQTAAPLEVRESDDSVQQQIQADGTVIVGQEGTNRIKISVPDPSNPSVIIIDQRNSLSANYIANNNGNQLSIHTNGRFGAVVLDSGKPSFQLLLSPGLGDSRLNVDDGTNGEATLQYWHRESSAAQIHPYLATHKGLVIRGKASQAGELLTFQGRSSTTDGREQAVIDTAWADSTDATRKGRLLLYASDSSGKREGLRIESDGSQANIGTTGNLFVGSTPAASGDRLRVMGGNILFQRTDSVLTLQIQGGNNGAGQFGDFTFSVGGGLKEFNWQNNLLAQSFMFVVGGNGATANHVCFGGTSPLARLHAQSMGDYRTIAGKAFSGQTAAMLSLFNANEGELYQVTAAGNQEFRRTSSTTEGRLVAGIEATLAVSTDTTRQGRLTLSATDYNATREFLRGEADGTNPKIGFLGAPAAARQGATTDLKDVIVTFGLLTNGGASPLNLDGGTLTASKVAAGAAAAEPTVDILAVASATDHIPIVARGVDGQTQSLLLAQNHLNQSRLALSNAGDLTIAGALEAATGRGAFGSTVESLVQLLSVAGATDRIPIVGRGMAGQTAVLMLAQNSSNQTQFSVANNGNTVIAGTLTQGGVLFPTPAAGDDGQYLRYNHGTLTYSLETPPTGSGSALSVATKTAAYTITGTDDVILGDATSAAFSLTLPTAASASTRTRPLIIKKIDSSANAVTIDGDGTETIDGATTAVLQYRYQAISLVSDGTNWHIN